MNSLTWPKLPAGPARSIVIASYSENILFKTLDRTNRPRGAFVPSLPLKRSRLSEGGEAFGPRKEAKAQEGGTFEGGVGGGHLGRFLPLAPASVLLAKGSFHS